MGSTLILDLFVDSDSPRLALPLSRLLPLHHSGVSRFSKAHLPKQLPHLFVIFTCCHGGYGIMPSACLLKDVCCLPYAMSMGPCHFMISDFPQIHLDVFISLTSILLTDAHDGSLVLAFFCLLSISPLEPECLSSSSVSIL